MTVEQVRTLYSKAIQDAKNAMQELQSIANAMDDHADSEQDAWKHSGEGRTYRRIADWIREDSGYLQTALDYISTEFE